MSDLKRGKEKTRDRLIQAAIEVFASAGILGATTREIARVAEVNEVTLFRHFHSKEQLLEAVVQQITALQAETLDNQQEWTQDLRQDLLHYAQIYTSMLEQHEALVRMFIGEAKRHPDGAVRVLQQSTLPLREKLTRYLDRYVAQGTVAPETDLLLAVDLLTGMLLAGVLRQQVSPTQRGYPRDHYIEACVNLFIRGICSETALTQFTTDLTDD